MKFHVNPGDPQAAALRSGSRDFNGERQIYKPPPIILTENLGGETGPVSATVSIPVPDSRCRVKVSVIFFPKAGNALPDISGQSSIWIAACDEDQKGVSGSAGFTLPVTNVEGTQGTPTTFPAAAGLAGYSREFVTAADWLKVTVSLARSFAVDGFWALQTRIQPDAVTLEWGEWDEIRRLFLPQRDS